MEIRLYAYFSPKRERFLLVARSCGFKKTRTDEQLSLRRQKVSFNGGFM